MLRKRKKNKGREGGKEGAREREGRGKEIDLRLFKADKLKQAHGFDYKAMATQRGFRPKKC